MSRALERLRQDLNDELLIRSGRNYELTAKAKRLQADLDNLLPQLEAMLSENEHDPLLLHERFRLTMNDHSCTIVLPHLVKRIATTAPHIRIEIQEFTDRRFDDVRTGRSDLLLDVSGAPTDLEVETLYQDEFVCVMAQDHPATENHLSLQEYLEYPHVLVNVLEGQQTLIDRILGEKTLHRKVGLILPYFTSAVFTVSHSKMILTAPKRLAFALGKNTDIRIVPAPSEFRPFSYQMIWHKRNTGDSVQAWFRDQVRNAIVFQKK